MKQVFFAVLILGLISFFILSFVKHKVSRDLAQTVEYPSVTKAANGPEGSKGSKNIKVSEIKKSLFVPYWTLDQGITPDYDQYVYFGIAASSNGVNMDDAGFSQIDSFLQNVPEGKSKLLALRMIDTENNLKILKDPAKQTAIIRETVSIAKEQGFDGIVLDLELSAIPFDSLVKQIISFTKQFVTETKKNNLSFTLTFYGDTFYRLRPFDVKALSQNADHFMIMAYDFSKSRGNPGPNFPLKGREVYGYDLEKMIEDFLQFIPAEKLTVIFGLFGYDWEVGSDGKALSYASPITYQQIQDKFLRGCSFADCSIKRKNDSRETEIIYKDEEGKGHRVWFEDRESMSDKQKYLKQKGISSYSFWANSYFE